MFTILLTSTEAEIILRAMSLASSTGQFPNPEIQGDQVRVRVLQVQIEKARDDYIDASWGKSKSRR